MSGMVQPGLRPFIVFDRVPDGCIAYAVADNRQMPLLRAGDWVIVDPDDRSPAEGELFVIQWQSGGGPRVVEAAIMPALKQSNGASLWAVGARHRGANAVAVVFGRPGEIVGDFPYRAEQLEERFRGRVIGILEATARELHRVKDVA